MSETIQYSGTLVVEHCWCGIRHAIPREIRDEQLQAHRDGRLQTGIYCPLGHKWSYSGEGEADRLRKELESKQRALETKQRSLEFERSQREAAERRESAQKAAKTRMKNRIAKGVCPCCNRSFENLHRHMKSKHPDYTKQEA